MEKHIVVVGSANIDLFAYMERLPLLGETVHGHRVSECCGGKGMNQAIMARRMAVTSTYMIAKIGQDVYGEKIRSSLVENGVDIKYVLDTDEASTGIAQIWVDDQGNNSIVIIPGANGLLEPVDVQNAEDIIATAAVLVCQGEIKEETTLEALRLASKHSVITIFNPAPAKIGLDEEFFRLPSIICPNESELHLLTDQPVEDLSEIKRAASVLLDKMQDSKNNDDRLKVVIVTLGGKGAFILHKNNPEGRLIPCPPTQALDTSGAGDAFIGSLAVHVSQNVQLEDAVQKSCKLASITVQRHGTQSSYPRKEELPLDLLP